jgi:hypothetical protein
MIESALEVDFLEDWASHVTVMGTTRPDTFEEDAALIAHCHR